jgi:hypothetical protein
MKTWNTRYRIITWRQDYEHIHGSEIAVCNLFTLRAIENPSVKVLWGDAAARGCGNAVDHWWGMKAGLNSGQGQRTE